MKTAVIAPISEEQDQLLRFFAERGFDVANTTVGLLSVASIPALNLLITRGGLGKAQFAVQTRHLLDHCDDAELVVCAGAAGSLTDSVNVGDVVVATKTIEHDFGNRFTDRPSPEFRAAPLALSRLETSALGFSVHSGPVASGDEDVVDVQRRQRLHMETGALAVAWEGAGGARACAFSQMPFVEMRGITDNADAAAPDDFQRNLPVAMANVAALILQLQRKSTEIYRKIAAQKLD